MSSCTGGRSTLYVELLGLFVLLARQERGKRPCQHKRNRARQSPTVASELPLMRRKYGRGHSERALANRSPNDRKALARRTARHACATNEQGGLFLGRRYLEASTLTFSTNPSTHTQCPQRPTSPAHWSAGWRCKCCQGQQMLPRTTNAAKDNTHVSLAEESPSRSPQRVSIR